MMMMSRVIQGDSGLAGGNTERLTVLPEQGVEF